MKSSKNGSIRFLPSVVYVDDTRESHYLAPGQVVCAYNLNYKDAHNAFEVQVKLRKYLADAKGRVFVAGQKDPVDVEKLLLSNDREHTKKVLQSLLQNPGGLATLLPDNYGAGLGCFGTREEKSQSLRQLLPYLDLPVSHRDLFPKWYVEDPEGPHVAYDVWAERGISLSEIPLPVCAGSAFSKLLPDWDEESLGSEVIEHYRGERLYVGYDIVDPRETFDRRITRADYEAGDGFDLEFGEQPVEDVQDPYYVWDEEVVRAMSRLVTGLQVDDGPKPVTRRRRPAESTDDAVERLHRV